MKRIERNMWVKLEDMPLGQVEWVVFERSGDEVYSLARGICQGQKAAYRQAKWAEKMIEKTSFFGPGEADCDKLALWEKQENKRQNNNRKSK